MSTITHCCFDLDWIVHRGGAAQLAGGVRLQGANERATAAEVMAHAVVLKARGFEVMPTCANYDARGHCKGHPA